MNEKCPNDGQSIEWHQHVGGTHPDGSPRTNGEFIGCDFAAPTPPAAEGADVPAVLSEDEREALADLCDNEATNGAGSDGYCYRHHAPVKWAGRANASDVCCVKVEQDVAPLLSARLAAAEREAAEYAERLAKVEQVRKTLGALSPTSAAEAEVQQAYDLALRAALSPADPTTDDSEA